MKWFWIAFITIGGVLVYRYMTATKRVFISFDYDYDRDYRYLLSALNSNSSSNINFYDVTPSEIQSDSVAVIKAVLTSKIRQATHTLVIIGAHATDWDPRSAQIGTRNWLWWEIEKSKEEGRRLVAVKIRKEYSSPDPILDAGAAWAMDFNVPAIIKAVESA